jgi:flagellar basal-body rod protein FlgF
MKDSVIDGYSGLQARLKILDVLTNNLANANTTGFKRDFARVFQDQVGLDSTKTHVDLSPGEVVTTGNELDIALTGPGFFVIDTPNGPRYTRSGNFSLNPAGELVTQDGMKVLSTSDSPIAIGEGQVAIGDTGTVTVDGNEVAALKVVTFDDSSKLQKEGRSRFLWNGTATGIRTVAEPAVKAASLERSNVNAVDEMVHLMSAFREFEAVQKSLKTLMTDMNDRLIQELGKLG